MPQNHPDGSRSEPAASTAAEYDVCVVGAGPVGLAFAMEASEIGLRILLLEAGDEHSSSHEPQPLAGQRTQIVDEASHVPVNIITRSGLGGTSWLWGGRCVTLEAADFEPREFVPDGTWPITLSDVEPYYDKAAQYMDCGTGVFRSSATEWEGLDAFTTTNLERWSRQPRLVTGLGSRLLARPNVDAMLNARLVDIAFADDGAVKSFKVVHDDQHKHVVARSYVLALGGIEGTRFLLDTQRRSPNAFGGIDGPLGRYYMGHTTGSVAEVVFDDPSRAADLDFELDAQGTYIRRRFTLTPEAQRKHGVLGTSFYIDNPPFYAYEHRNATLSLVFLGLAIKPLGNRLVAERIRRRHVGSRPYHVSEHLQNVLRHPWDAAKDVIDVIRRRYLSSVRKPGFLLQNEGGRYALHYHSEQVPDPQSRMTMRTDPDGDAVLVIDYHYSEQDIESLLRAHELLDQDLRAAGHGRLEYLAADTDGVRAELWNQALGGFHNIGTTRMSEDPTTGVVDRDCRVHGTPNLYIASCSVFPTAAEANPTFFAAVLAVRLAHHLAAGTEVAKHSGDTAQPNEIS